MESTMRRSPNYSAGTSYRSAPVYSPAASSSSQAKRNAATPQPRAVPELLGRARKNADLKKLLEEAQTLEDELYRLETLPPASDVCKELVLSVDGQIDPFLANSTPQMRWDPNWDRWFRGPPVPRSTCCCILSPRI